MNKEIKLHTIATFQDKEYKLEELLNELLKENFKLQQRIDEAIRYLKSFKLNDEEFNTNELLEILKGKE